MDCLTIFVVVRVGTTFELHEQRVYGPGQTSPPEGFREDPDAVGESLIFRALKPALRTSALGICRQWMATHRPDLIRMARHPNDDPSIVETYL